MTVPLPPLGEFEGLDRKLYFMVESGKEIRRTALGISQIADPVARLWAAGRIRAASPNPPPWPKRSSAKYAGRTPAEVDALLAEMRGDR